MPKGKENESEGFILSLKRPKMKVYANPQKVVSSNRNTNNIRTKCKVETSWLMKNMNDIFFMADFNGFQKATEKKLKKAVTISGNWITLIKGVCCVNPKSDSHQQQVDRKDSIRLSIVHGSDGKRIIQNTKDEMNASLTFIE